MLESLVINNIVLIDKLNIQFEKGLCVLTGETGSGKSILLDALGLAIGYRSNSRLLRSGEQKGSVIASFNLKDNIKTKNLLKECDIGFDDNIIIRRTLTDDGTSKAFINETPVTQKFLQTIGESLLEIHGQNEQIGLLNSSVHREILDQYGNLIGKRKNVSEIFEKLKTTKEKLKELMDKKDNIEKEKDYLVHITNEIEILNIGENEEQELAEKRTLMMNKEKILSVLNDVKNTLEGQANVGKQIKNAQNALYRASALGDNLLENGKNAFSDVVDNLEQTSINLDEASYKLEIIYNGLGFDGATLEQTEERLFAIRGLARKLNVSPNILNELLMELKEKLSFLNKQEFIMGDLEMELNGLKELFLKEARELSENRRQAAKKLTFELKEELAPLKMEKTIFDTEFRELSEENWNTNGIDNVRFIASTNPGMPMDELSKIASGGELSRFMLALKVVLSQVSSVPILIFDEIDTGISGAVADAVGERLRKLGRNLQVLVVTHLAQVASKGNSHFKVHKEQRDNTTITSVILLDNESRINEIARIISGENITDEAKKIAKEMLN
ncbi:MAG: DNA repair protein RecN [Rickettsiales bacterium]|jgi:DNA repair protein RecN (Recombination protein N)|nr:DNA repair protein RecN [Rickettsiales bacterium]